MSSVGTITITVDRPTITLTSGEGNYNQYLAMILPGEHPYDIVNEKGTITITNDRNTITLTNE